MRNLKYKLKIGLFALVPIMFGVFLAAFAMGETLPIKTNASNTTASVSTTVTQGNTTTVVEDVEKYFYSINDEVKESRILAESYIVGDLATGEIIMVKNPE